MIAGSIWRTIRADMVHSYFLCFGQDPSSDKYVVMPLVDKGENFEGKIFVVRSNWFNNNELEFTDLIERVM
jgi:hypothetical protein